MVHFKSRKLFSLIVLVFLLNIVQAQNPKRTVVISENNTLDECMMPFFEIENAYDRADSVRKGNNLYIMKRQLKDLLENIEWFILYQDDCKCMIDLEGDIYLFLPDYLVLSALKAENIYEIKILANDIHEHLEFVWMIIADCI